MRLGQRASATFRATASVLIVVALIWWAGPADVIGLLRRASLPGIGVLIGLHAADRVLMAYKWWRLLRARGNALRLADAVRAYFLGSFVGAVLPIAGGADVTRIAAVRGRGVPTESLISSVALERALGAISHGLYCVGAVALALALRADLQLSTTVLAGSAVGFVVLLTLLLPLSFAAAGHIAARLDGGEGFGARLAALAADYAGWRRHPRELWIFLMLTLLEGLYPIFTYYGAALALGLSVTAVDMAIVVPLAFLLPRLPIPLPSLGPEQGAFVVLAVQLGLAQEEATAITLLFLATLLIAFAPGALAWLTQRPQATVD
jgi:hypothetical protein